MTTPKPQRLIAASIALAALFNAMALGDAPSTAKQLAVGEDARDFELIALGGESVKLSKQVEAGPVVLVVLRGFPGYQCPICTRQFGEFLAHANDFKDAGATVLFVYPGPAEELKKRAAEFVKGKDYPAHFQILLDPDFAFTNAYGLRWDAKGETAYPSTFVIDTSNNVTFAKISKTHGDRSHVTEILKAVEAKRE